MGRGRGRRDSRGGDSRGGAETGGQGGGRGRGRRVMSFLKPCLLVLLHRGRSHGYHLLQGLDEFGFRPGRKDPSLVYRALREMEADGLVISSWDDENSAGPQRRVYQITAEGEGHMGGWVEDLKTTRQEIDSLLSAYSQVGQSGSRGGENQ